MKTKRKNEMSELEQAVMSMLYSDVKDIPDDGYWRKYENSFIYEQKNYKMKCEFKISNETLTYKNLSISYDTQIIDISNGVH